MSSRGIYRTEIAIKDNEDEKEIIDLSDKEAHALVEFSYDSKFKQRYALEAILLFSLQLSEESKRKYDKGEESQSHSAQDIMHSLIHEYITKPSTFIEMIDKCIAEVEEINNATDSNDNSKDHRDTYRVLDKVFQGTYITE